MGSCTSCSSDRKPRPKPWKNPQVLTSVLSGVLLGVGFLGSRYGLSEITANWIYIASVIVGGYFFAREAIEELIKEREVGIELLMSIAAVAAGFMGQWAEASTLVFLYSISEASEGYTKDRARNAIRALMDLTPKTALVRRGDTESRIPVEELKTGDTFIVLPGEALPTDGDVLSGHSSVNQAPVTGESVPVEKATGDKVFAGTLNGEAALTVRATKDFRNNTIARIVELVEKAQASKGQSERFIQRFGKRYSPAVLAIGVLIAIIPPLLGLPWSEWFTRAIVFIVAAAPCALVISVPITLVAALGTAGRNGVLVKGGVHLENLAKIKVVALDKTGTLTLGHPEVTDIVPMNGVSETELLTAAAAIESRSQHPLAKAILKHAEAMKLRIEPAEGFRSVTGQGARGSVSGMEFYVGNPKLFLSIGTSLEGVRPKLAALEAQGKTVIILGTVEKLWGLIAIADPVRSEAKAAILELKRAGIEKVVMLTGDNERAAKSIAAQVGVDEVFAELNPEEKTKKILELESRYGKVIMVGDGINDAPALAAAHVGIAMGAAGTDVALETADVALMSDNLSKLPYLMQLSHRNWRTIQQNLVLSVIVIGTLAVGAVVGLFTLPIAVVGHELSELVVIMSGLRMLRT